MAAPECSSFSSLQAVPPELIEQFVDHHSIDIPTLCAICATSKALRPFAIKHLFSNINLSYRSDIVQWHEMVKRVPELETSIVKRVIFDPDNKLNRTSISNEKHWETQSYALQIHSMPSVCTLDCFAAPPGGRHFLRLFPNITSLHFNGFKLYDWLELAEFLGVFPQLKTLQLEDLEFGADENSDENSEGEERYSSRPSPAIFPCDLGPLESLSILGYLDEAIDRLLLQSTPNSLKSLQIGDWYDNGTCSIALIEKLLALNAGTIQDLYFNSRCISGTVTLAQLLSKSPPMKALRSISLPQILGGVSSDSDSPHAAAYVHWEGHQLDSAKLVFSDWPRFMEEFFPKIFPSLRRVVLVLFCFRRPSDLARRSIKRGICSQIPETFGSLFSIVWTWVNQTLHQDTGEDKLDYNDVSSLEELEEEQGHEV
ncbi:hypothetical protein C8J56DRAFT_106002 [Mycena floridula]|nr:hypothetical protein C8J56DRAFT_106002 [Mycena floridula]